jgi:hypothetical protein
MYDGDAVLDLSTQRMLAAKWKALTLHDLTTAASLRKKFSSIWENSDKSDLQATKNAFGQRWAEINGSTFEEFTRLFHLPPQPSTNVLVIPTINEAIEHARGLSSPTERLDVFITGSLHLVGGALSVLGGIDDQLHSGNGHVAEEEVGDGKH